MRRNIVILGFLILIQLTITSQDFLDWREYERLYKHVELMPENLKKDPERIVNYLKKAAIDKRELIEILYYWISNNISYDVEGYSKTDYGAVDGLSVLKTRKTVCQGYAELFKLLCDKANIECVIITGYGKGYGYDGTREDKPNHAWNAVKLNNQWKLVDVTWGSGYIEAVNDSLVYKKNLNLGYIFTKPDGFIIKHFPEDSKWQLLDKPISMDEFYSKEMDEKIEHIIRFLR